MEGVLFVHEVGSDVPGVEVRARHILLRLTADAPQAARDSVQALAAQLRDRMVRLERRIGPEYDGAWAWALAMTREERQARLRALRMRLDYRPVL